MERVPNSIFNIQFCFVSKETFPVKVDLKISVRNDIENAHALVKALWILRVPRELGRKIRSKSYSIFAIVRGLHDDNKIIANGTSSIRQQV